MTEIIQHQITSADAWIGSEMQRTDDWVWNLTEEDLSEITEYMADRKHPGKMLAKGHLGFAGHGDEHTFQFRRLSVKKLK